MMLSRSDGACCCGRCNVCSCTGVTETPSERLPTGVFGAHAGLDGRRRLRTCLPLPVSWPQGRDQQAAVSVMAVVPCYRAVGGLRLPLPAALRPGLISRMTGEHDVAGSPRVPGQDDRRDSGGCDVAAEFGGLCGSLERRWGGGRGGHRCPTAQLSGAQCRRPVPVGRRGRGGEQGGGLPVALV